MNVTIITAGKIKEKYLKDGIDEYGKRLKRFCSLEIIEVGDERAPENPSQREIEIIKDREGESIRKRLKDGMYKIALCIEGKMMSSEELSGKIGSLMTGGTGHIAFIIGGSYGLSESIVQECDMRLSFSKFTFPHQLMRLILLEQIYRCFKIMSNETYHK